MEEKKIFSVLAIVKTVCQNVFCSKQNDERRNRKILCLLRNIQKTQRVSMIFVFLCVNSLFKELNGRFTSGEFPLLFMGCVGFGYYFLFRVQVIFGEIYFQKLHMIQIWLVPLFGYPFLNTCAKMSSSYHFEFLLSFFVPKMPLSAAKKNKIFPNVKRIFITTQEICHEYGSYITAYRVRVQERHTSEKIQRCKFSDFLQ